jgi:hypothetical protein
MGFAEHYFRCNGMADVFEMQFEAQSRAIRVETQRFRYLEVYRYPWMLGEVQIHSAR